MKRIMLILIGVVTVAATAIYMWPAPKPVAHVYFETAPTDRVEKIAHGGGLGHAPPNTILALELALAMGADVLEGDVQQAKDGVMVLRHDDTLDRTTDFTGLIADYTWSELASADAGARTLIDGQSYAGRGIKIPRMDDALARFPNTRWVLEIKNDTPAAAIAMCATIRDAGAETRVLVASFHDEAMAQFRAACPGVATSMSSREVRHFVIAARLGVSRFIETPAVAMQLPVSADGIDLTHPRIVAAAKARGIRLQYWTINDPEAMRHLMVLGADGLITDYVDRVDQVIARERHH